MEHEKISVIIPARNEESEIRNAIDSVFKNKTFGAAGSSDP